MEVKLNGKPQVITDNQSVAEMIANLYDTDKGIAVAVNNTLVPRGKWEEHRLMPADEIVIIKAAYGG
ncbi:MAG: sulfur carrier protein ThiS [Candidatus Amulumruptor sp.]